MTLALEFKVEPAFKEGYVVFVLERCQGSEYFAWAQRGHSMDLLPWAELRKRPRQRIDAARVLDILRVLDDVSLPALPPFVLGHDGVTSTLTVSKGMNQATFRWWGELPKEWIPLAPIVRKLEELALELTRG
ncbi:hypothetical protein [Nitrosomonas sp. Nm33]|uniref:hypothetical protein n=1 Tax=Nitrosomonas sp. Nm33 TaxID=133724 RepID=UPI000899D6A0|nr:hypothetical protein [Nitrosomonas sp. Nm33]SDY74483.1 hypothetical protein SAMN05421755_104419 [Nitrosomonas sp. Nm33]